MAQLFLSYSRADRAKAARVAAALEDEGRSLWWDRQLASGEDYATVIEREIEAAQCVVVAWSGTARDSLWVRAEANEALDQGKLVQINFDGAKLPLPFTMLHWLDFRHWRGSRDNPPWPQLEGRIVEVSGGARPERLGYAAPPPEPPLQGLGKAAAAGWAALALAVLLLLSVLLTARGLVEAEAFASISLFALVASVLLLAASAYLFARIMRASRR